MTENKDSKKGHYYPLKSMRHTHLSLSRRRNPSKYPFVAAFNRNARPKNNREIYLLEEIFSLAHQVETEISHSTKDHRDKNSCFTAVPQKSNMRVKVLKKRQRNQLAQKKLILDTFSTHSISSRTISLNHPLPYIYITFSLLLNLSLTCPLFHAIFNIFLKNEEDR